MKFEHFEVLSLDSEEKIHKFIQFLEAQVSMAPSSVSFSLSIKMTRDVDFTFADVVPHPCVVLHDLAANISEEKVVQSQEKVENKVTDNIVAKKEDVVSDRKIEIKKRRRRRRYAIDASERNT